MSYTPRLRNKYQDEVVPALIKEFGYTNVMEVPKLVKVPIDRMAENEKAERVFLNLLASFAEQGRRVNHAGGSNYAPKAFEEHPNADGCTKRALKKAMAALLNKEKIKISEDGPPSKRRSFLEIV